jgi:hypothetical protein
MPNVWVPRKQIEDGSLPPVCLVCGAKARERRFPGLSAPSMGWLLVAPLFGLLSFWACILVASFQSSDDDAGFPFCSRHRNYWPRRAWFIVVGWIVGIATFVLVGAQNSSGTAGKSQDPGGLAVFLGIWLLGFLPTFLIVQLRAVRAIGNERNAVQLSGASRKFVAALEDGAEAEPPRRKRKIPHPLPEE